MISCLVCRSDVRWTGADFGSCLCSRLVALPDDENDGWIELWFSSRPFGRGLEELQVSWKGGFVYHGPGRPDGGFNPVVLGEDDIVRAVSDTALAGQAWEVIGT